MKKVAVLFARKNSIYKTMESMDVYDIERDAFTFVPGLPVIAHPPCRAFGKLRHFAKPRDGEKECAYFAVNMVRLCGGVLEHPAHSKLWSDMDMPLPGSGFDSFGGWSLSIDQGWFGHRGKKRTWLYIVGVAPSDIPPYPLYSELATVPVEDMGRAEREATPYALAVWLNKLCMLLPGYVS